MTTALRDGEEVEVHSRGHHWAVSWHPPPSAPAGRPDGAAGLCVTGDGRIVLISTDQLLWDFPAGRPEGDEDWEQTLRREVREEACAVVTGARLLGFSRGHRLDGDQKGVSRVRSIWLAPVEGAGMGPAV